ncbi:hypothetical protein HRM2_27180 [Desulforapulum autotrophicum HRM2]|uniref:Lipoprotein n=1 Tax=Desulforapulum autotrophicum (strain ATCC 43914 / DSM 3382 / VKM B-1955 / HRM2) TaxID=177437 RepID=C0QI74_DESAH|nr:LPS assembly lipoprotein LptE [Desulforapulum autotrophicum]ACN15810.1 hypothetical protein HRM2_27180 [Desulforapulum autotrophicum HRM2]
MMNDRFVIRGLLALVFILSGCGYTLSNGGTLPGKVTRVAVTMFENQSFESGAETTFTSSLMKELLQKSSAMVVERNGADAVITGTIRSITIAAFTRTADDEVVERQVSAVIDLDMVDANGETLWSVHNFSAKEVFTVTSFNLLDEAAKAEAIERIATRVSERIVDQMRDGF